jgi:hypothetical protein
MIAALALKIRRALDLVAPADGLCHFVQRTWTRETFGDQFRTYDSVMRCQGEWHHTGAHSGPITEERS